MRKKKVFICLALIVLSLLPLRAEKTKLLVWQNDGTQTLIELNEKPVITFTDDKMLVSSRTGHLEVDRKKLVRFTYLREDDNAVGAIDSPTDSFVNEGESLLFFARGKSLSVRLCSINGVVVSECTVPKGEQFRLSLNSLLKGIYVVEVNGITTKIVRQ